MPSPKELMQALWMKAAASDAAVAVACASEADARKLRWSLYNAVGQARKGPPSALRDAVEAVQIRVDGCTVTLQRAETTATMQAVLAALGDDALDPVAAEAAAAEKRMLEALGQVAPVADAEPGKVNPYYTREGVQS